MPTGPTIAMSRITLMVSERITEQASTTMDIGNTITDIRIIAIIDTTATTTIERREPRWQRNGT